MNTKLLKKAIIQSFYKIIQNHTTKFFTENLLAIEMRKTQILMNKPVYLGLSILDLSIIIYGSWYCSKSKTRI